MQMLLSDKIEAIKYEPSETSRVLNVVQEVRVRCQVHKKLICYHTHPFCQQVKQNLTLNWQCDLVQL